MSNSPSRITPPINSEQDKRKVLNRLAQRAFRRRQAEALRELKIRVDAGQTSNSEVVEALEQENCVLRKQLTDVQGQLERLQATIQAVTGSIATTLDKRETGVRKKPRELQELRATEKDKSKATGECHTNKRFNFCHTALSATSAILEGNCQTIPDMNASQLGVGDYLQGSEYSPSATLWQQIPNTWTFQYQMGPQSYSDSFRTSQHSSIAPGHTWVDSTSPFSDHIKVLKCLLKNKLNQSSLMASHPQLLYQPVSMVLAMFNSITRPDVMVWYAQTRFYHIIELMAWQLSPSPTTFSKLHERYWQTETQIKFVDRYPCVIDWIPFPAIRDQLIQLHTTNPRIDQVFCDAVSAYVVETCLSDLILGGLPVTAYIRVNDLIQAMSLHEADDSGLAASLPVFDSSTLFTSPQHALLVFKLLKMDHGASQYKIDPAFFSKYPELYCAGMDNMIASGIPLKPDVQTTLTCPKYLDNSTVGTYRSFIEFSFDAAAEIVNTKKAYGGLDL